MAKRKNGKAVGSNKPAENKTTKLEPIVVTDSSVATFESNTRRVICTRDPKLFFDIKAFQKMQAIVSMCSFSEIGWLGKIEELGNDEFLLTDIYVLKQRVHGATCEMTTDGITDTYLELIQEQGVEETNKICLWGHSHVKMKPNPSQQDERMFAEIRDHGLNYFFRLITNQAGEFNIAIFDANAQIIIEGIEWGIYSDNVSDIYAEAKVEIESKLTEIKYAQPKRKTTYIGGYPTVRWPDDEFDHYGTMGGAVMSTTNPTNFVTTIYSVPALTQLYTDDELIDKASTCLLNANLDGKLFESTREEIKEAIEMFFWVVFNQTDTGIKFATETVVNGVQNYMTNLVMSEIEDLKGVIESEEVKV